MSCAITKTGTCKAFGLNNCG
ncbi:hypothetical protein [uncultured Mucilaginibacter sp.]